MPVALPLREAALPSSRPSSNQPSCDGATWFSPAGKRWKSSQRDREMQTQHRPEQRGREGDREQGHSEGRVAHPCCVDLRPPHLHKLRSSLVRVTADLRSAALVVDYLHARAVIAAHRDQAHRLTGLEVPLHAHST